MYSSLTASRLLVPIGRFPAVFVSPCVWRFAVYCDELVKLLKISLPVAPRSLFPPTGVFNEHVTDTRD